MHTDFIIVLKFFCLVNEDFKDDVRVLLIGGDNKFDEFGDGLVIQIL